MRLICPNCGAQYEVDDAVIPDKGRDVQCSNCGHTWFQQPAHLDAELADELQEDFYPSDDLIEESDEYVDDAAESEVEVENAEAPALQRQELDPGIADMLREEADHEAAARQADADQLETQPDLGLDDADAEAAAARSAAARARMARLRGLDEEDTQAEAALIGAASTSTSRSELLPDVEEINSSLRASEDRETSGVGGEIVPSDAETAAYPKKKGGRRIFWLIILIAIVGIAVYAFAPQLIKAVPQTEPYLVPYVEWANEMRGKIDSGLETVIGKIQGWMGSSGE